MIKENSKKIIAMLMLVLTLFSTLSSSVFATEISSANIENNGDVEWHLQYWNEERQAWSYIKTTYTTYHEGGREYPAYCINKEYPGVGELEGYTVDVNASITDVLGNVQIWRTIINGFPYKSAGELGLANDLEAFQATKQAVYCILYDFDPESRYRSAEQGSDERGDAIRKAIINMVNAGRYGYQMPSDPDITLSNSGNLYDDGDYHTQKIDVSSTVDMANYTITATANLPEGTIITNSNGTQTDYFNGNESMYVKIPKAQMAQDISNAIINVQGKCKTYPVFYGKTRTAGTQNYALTYDPFGDGVGRATLNIKTNTGKVLVNKTDDETKQPIEGVKFSLKKADGTVVGTATIDKNGVATFDKLYQANYKLVEVETNPKYILNKSEFDVSVEYNKTAKIDIENEHKKGNIKVYKIDKDNNRVVLGNVEFDLFSHEFNKVIGTYYTDENGELQIDNLRIGDYSLIEKKTNKWYNLAEDTDIKVEWNLTKEIQIENELKKGAIKIIKVDKENHEVKLENVKFKVMDKDNNVLEELITDKNGEAETSNYPIRDFSQLKIQEVETLKNYSNSSIKKFYELLNHAFRSAFERDYIKSNPMKNVIKPKSKKEDKNIRALTIEEQEKFTQYLLEQNIKDTPYRNVFLIQMFTGMRIGEVLALKTTDINLAYNIITVEHTISVDAEEKIILKENPKTFNGIREIPILSYLKPYIMEQMDIAKINNHKENLLFVNRNKGYVDHRIVNKILKKMLEELDIEGISTHSLRHTFGTRCMESGVRDVALQRMMGHSSIAVTLNNYVDVSEELKENELKKVYSYYRDNMNIDIDNSD